jgi:6-phosphogluconolactonase
VLYELLASPAWSSRLDWANSHVFWGDERMVPADNPDSNFLLAQRTLLARVPIPAGQIHRIRTEDGDETAVAAAYEAELRVDFRTAAGDIPRLDLVLLGLGGDGHIASLFPGYPTLTETERLVVSSPPGRLPPPVDRVTLTLSVINAARTIAFLVAGAEKVPALRGALAGDQSLPAARVAPAEGTVHWFVDQAAFGSGGAR